MQLSSNVVLRNIAQLYVQLVRGVPIIVQITYWVIVIFPFLVNVINAWGVSLAESGTLAADNWMIDFKVAQVTRGVIALAFSYGAFSSEIFRAGIQSIEKGQVEAGKAIGLKWLQAFRFIVLPQAFRRVLPPLGNDFIAMLKESSLLSVIGINEITLQSKQYAARSFLFLETYTTGAFLYLSMTLLLSMGVRYMERRMKSDTRNE
jgi:polar amino acid transport system permease protein